METNSSAETAHHEDSKDLISALPENAAYRIMRSLPLINAARMSILSSTWRTRWLLLPYLVFDREFYMLFDHVYDIDGQYAEADAYKWSTSISNILLLHKGDIVELSVTIPNFESFPGPDISPWLSYVSRMGVKSLTIQNKNEYSPYKWPPFLFSQLENLSLRGCVIGHMSRYRGLRNLLSLKLDKVEFTERRYRNFIRWCPLLETLSFSRCSFDGEFIIDWPKLKNLSLALLIMVSTSNFLRFENASSLLSLSLYSLDDDMIPGAVDMIKYLASSCKLERLSLQHYSCLILDDMGVSKILPVTFEHLKTLELVDIRVDEEVGESLCVLGMVRSCPNMKELKISFRDYHSRLAKLKKKLEEADISIDHDSGTSELYHFEIPRCTFNRLRRIYLIKMVGVDEELKLTSYLLCHSPSLEKLSFTTPPDLVGPLLSWLCKKLQLCSKAPTAKIVRVLTWRSAILVD